MTEPWPCIYCGGTHLSIRAVVFRVWNIHCDSCEAKGPTGQTPDEAIDNWNSYHNASLKRRKILDMSDVDQPNIQKIWKALRAMRTFTVNDVALVTELTDKRETVYKYIYLLEKAGYLRLEAKKSKPGAPNVYRIIEAGQVTAPGWSQLKYKRIDQAMRREDVKGLRPVKVKAGRRRETGDRRPENQF